MYGEVCAQAFSKPEDEGAHDHGRRGLEACFARQDRVRASCLASELTALQEAPIPLPQSRENEAQPRVTGADSQVCARWSATALAQPRSYVCPRSPPAAAIRPNMWGADEATRAAENACGVPLPRMAGERRKTTKKGAHLERGPADPSAAPGSGASKHLPPKVLAHEPSNGLDVAPRTREVTHCSRQPAKADFLDFALCLQCQG